MPRKQVKKSTKAPSRPSKSVAPKKGKTSAAMMKVAKKSVPKKKTPARKTATSRPAMKAAKKVAKRRTPVAAAASRRSATASKPAAKRSTLSPAAKRLPVQMKGKPVSRGRGEGSTKSSKPVESGDFGTPVSRATPRGRARDAAEGLPSVEQARAGSGSIESPDADGGDRESGVGMPESGPGGASGGDSDPEFVGIAGAGGLAMNSPDHSFASGPDDAPSFNSSMPGAKRSPQHLLVSNPPPGSTVDRSGGDASTTGDGGGSASASSEHLDDSEDDAAAGEISLGEASGDDD